MDQFSTQAFKKLAAKIVEAEKSCHEGILQISPHDQIQRNASAVLTYRNVTEMMLEVERDLNSGGAQ